MIISFHSEEQFLKLDFVTKYSVKSSREMCADLNHDLVCLKKIITLTTTAYMYQCTPFFQSTITEAFCKVY